MKTFSLYHLATGLFDGRSLTLPESMLALNVPAGMGALEGVFDHRAERLDLASGAVVPWTPPPPDPAELEAARLRQAQQRAAQLEAGQARALRALALDPTDQTARARLADIEAAIVAAGIRGKTGA